MSCIKFLLESVAPCYLAGAMQTASNIHTTLAFRTATDAPANVTQAANIARLLTIKIGRGIGAGKYDCEVRADLLETLGTSVVRCAYGSVSL